MVIDLPGAISGICMEPGRLHLMPQPAEPRACHRLAARCRALAALGPELGEAGRSLPGTLAVQWVAVPLHGRLPLPLLAFPAGAPLDAWLSGPGAAAAPLLSMLGDLVGTVDALAGRGFLPTDPALAQVWVADGRLSWLPGPLAWERRGRSATGQSLQAAGRWLAVLLNHLLQSARGVPGIEMVWDELWALCYGLTEHGYGVNAQNVRATLEILEHRCLGARDRWSRPADTYVLVDASDLQECLGRRTLDLAGYLRALIGSSERISGTVFGTGRLPRYWPEQAKAAGLDWMEPGRLEIGAVAEQFRSVGAETLIYLGGKRVDADRRLLPLQPVRGLLGLLEPAQANLPERWSAIGLPQPLNAWCRVGWPDVEHLGVSREDAVDVT